jgi:hypothetical protein
LDRPFSPALGNCSAIAEETNRAQSRLYRFR